MQPEVTQAERDAYNQTVDELCVMLLDGVPKNLRALIPTEMTARQQITWYCDALAAGAIDKPTVPPTDGGARPAITPTTPDTSSLPIHARLAAGYN